MTQVSEKDYGDVQIAARVITVREESGMSMDAFALILGVSQPTQSRIERAKRMPDAGYLRALRERFGTDLNELVCGPSRARSGGQQSQVITGSGNVVAGGNVANINGTRPRTKVPRSA